MAFNNTSKAIELREKIDNASKMRSGATFFRMKHNLEKEMLFSVEFNQISRKSYDILLRYLDRNMPDRRANSRELSKNGDLEKVTRRR
jgi:hypothetical protein